MRIPPPSIRISEKVLLSCILLLGCALRLPGLFHALWLDEIWSQSVIARFSSLLQIFTDFRHDNNHFLNSVFIYLVGAEPSRYWFKFRLLSFFTGALSVPLVYLISAKIYPSKGWRALTALMAAVSFPLIVYSNEARGYAPAVFFALLSFYLLTQALRKASLPLLLSFNCSFLLGLFSHFSFLYIGAGLFILAVSVLARQPASLSGKAATLAKLFIVPLSAGAGLFLGYIMGLEYGGGGLFSRLEVANETLAYLAAYPQYSGVLVSFFSLFFLVYALIFLLKKGSWLALFCTFCLGAIFAHVILKEPKPLYFRYFLCLYPFLIILFVYSLYLFWQSRPWSRPFLAAFIILIIIGNFGNDLRFFKSGRGDYPAAIRYMQEHTVSDLISVSSDHDFRNPLLLDFYGPLYLAGKKIRYVPRDKVKQDPPDWFIRHSFGRAKMIGESVLLGNGFSYRLMKSYPYAGMLSGANWFLYRREPKS